VKTIAREVVIGRVIGRPLAAPEWLLVQSLRL
jgi:hypothetical protein